MILRVTLTLNTLQIAVIIRRIGVDYCIIVASRHLLQWGMPKKDKKPNETKRRKKLQRYRCPHREVKQSEVLACKDQKKVEA
jgi:hypothetical protein